MLKPLRLAICLIVAPAVLASGCGSTKSTTTHTTVASTPAIAGKSATGSTSATGSRAATTGTHAATGTHATTSGVAARSSASKYPASISGFSPKQTQHFKEAKEIQHQLAAGHLTKQAAKAKREHVEKALENETIGKVGTEAIRARVPSRRQFPTEVQRQFVTGCTEAKKSISSCECLLAKFEEGKGERALRIAEATYSEARLRLHEVLAPKIEVWVKECARA